MPALLGNDGPRTVTSPLLFFHACHHSKGDHPKHQVIIGLNGNMDQIAIWLCLICSGAWIAPPLGAILEHGNIWNLIWNMLPRTF